MISKQTPPHFVFIKLGAIGDLFFSLPICTYLKKKSPGCKVSWIVGSKLKTLLEGHPDIDHLISIDESQLYSTKLSQKIKATLSLRSQIKAQKPTHILIAYRNTSLSMALLGLAPIFQLSRKPHPVLQTLIHFAEVPPLTLHESLAIKKLADLALNHKPHTQIKFQPNLSYLLKPSELHTLPTPLPNKYLILHVGGGQNQKTEFTLKQWPHWPKLLQKLQQNEYNIILIGGPNDAQEVEQKLTDHKLPNTEKLTASQNPLIINLVGKLSLTQTIQVISKAQGFIGPDSGPLHIADAFQIPCLGLYGPTSPISWGLLSPNSKIISTKPNCSPCYKDDGIFPPCSHNHQCMTQLSEDQVYAEVQKMLQ